MHLSLTNYKDALSPALLLKAGKCTVRECDEPQKNVYEGYVDEGPESYDVSIRFSPKKEITAHQCDCGSTEPFCRHKTALLTAVAGTAKKPATSVKMAKSAKSKQSKTDALLEAADADNLKAWVKELLDKNKDLALAFVQRFGEQKTVYTKADAEAITAEAVKSVVKNRRRVEQSELKKIVALWTDVHRPIVEAYIANVTIEEAFVAFHTVLDACFAFAEKLSATGVKIPSYVESLLNQTAEPIAVLYTDESFEIATAFYRNNLPDKYYSIRLHYLQHLQKILSLSTPERLASGADKLVQQYANANSDKLVNGTAYTKMLFGFLERNGLLPKYLTVFKPITFDNPFNILLLEKLTDAGAFDVAEEYAKKQIAGNYREEYNLPYWELLQKLYNLQKAEEKLAEVTAQLLPYTFNFDDYLFVYNRMPEGEEKKKWRTKLITKAKSASAHGRNASRVFYFRLLDYEKSYKKMIASIDSYTPYLLICTYYQPMALTDKQGLLQAIINKNDEYDWRYREDDDDNDEEQQCLQKLFVAMEKTYGRHTLQAVVKQAGSGRYYFRSNRLLDYLKQEWATT